MKQFFRHTATRIAGLLGIGRVASQKDDGAVQTVQYQTPLEVAFAPRLTEFGFSSALPVGADVVLAFLGGDRSSPVVIASNHQGYRRAGLNPGETVIYSQWGREILLTEKGVFIDARGQNVEASNATTVTINASEGVMMKSPWLKCTGDIIDNCTTNTHSVKALREAYLHHKHEMNHVQGGSDSLSSEATTEPLK